MTIEFLNVTITGPWWFQTIMWSPFLTIPVLTIYLIAKDFIHSQHKQTGGE